MDNFQYGIGILSAMTQNPADSSMAPFLVKQYIDDGVDPEMIIASLSNLCSLLLVLHKNTTGLTEGETLRRVAFVLSAADSDG